jgi:DNA repair protein RadC
MATTSSSTQDAGILAAPAHAPNVFTTSESALINCALSLIEEKRLKLAPVLYYMQDFERYLRLRFAGLTNEQGHTLYLNVNRELLSAETEFFGDQKSVAWDIRKTVSRAIQLGADFVVLAHNHPNNNASPSDQDIDHLNWMERTLQPLKITLLDSFVVTASNVTSIKTVLQQNKEREDQERSARWDRERAEKSARRAANKAAKFAAAQQAQGAAA